VDRPRGRGTGRGPHRLAPARGRGRPMHDACGRPRAP